MFYFAFAFKILSALRFGALGPLPPLPLTRSWLKRTTLPNKKSDEQQKGLTIKNNRKQSLFLIHNDQFSTRYGPTDEVAGIRFYVIQKVTDVPEEIGATARPVRPTRRWVVLTNIVRPTYMFILWCHCEHRLGGPSTLLL